MPSKQYDEEGAGRYLGGDDNPVSMRTLQRWRAEGSGPDFMKMGKLIRYGEPALDDFKQSRTFRSIAEAEAA